MKSNLKRFLSLMLAFLMVISNVPAQAFATEGEDSGHGHIYVGETTLAPTCEAEGVTTFTCSVEGCDKPTYTEPIDALGHSYVDGVCSVCGASDPSYVAPETPSEEPVEVASEEGETTESEDQTVKINFYCLVGFELDGYEWGTHWFKDGETPIPALVKSIEVPVGTTLDLTSAEYVPVLEDYTFRGWYMDPWAVEEYNKKVSFTVTADHLAANNDVAANGLTGLHFTAGFRDIMETYTFHPVVEVPNGMALLTCYIGESEIGNFELTFNTDGTIGFTIPAAIEKVYLTLHDANGVRRIVGPIPVKGGGDINESDYPAPTPISKQKVYLNPNGQNYNYVFAVYGCTNETCPAHGHMVPNATMTKNADGKWVTDAFAVYCVMCAPVLYADDNKIEVTGGYQNTSGEEGGGWFEYTVSAATEPETPAITIPDNLTDAEKAIAEEIQANTAITAFEVPDAVKEEMDELKIALTAVDASTNKLTFDISPMKGDDKVSSLAQAITFRLPIPSSVTESFAKIFHKDVLSGIVAIQGEGNAKYVEVSSKNFSKFEVEPTEVSAMDFDFTDASSNEEGEGYVWNNASKTLTLSGAEITEAVKLPAGSTIVVTAGTGNSIAVSGAAPVTTSGDLSITGTGALSITTDAEHHTIVGAETIAVEGTSLTTYGFAGLSSRHVVIKDAKVDITGYGYGIYYNGTTGSTSVTLHNVTGTIESEADCGIELYMEYNSDNSADDKDSAFVLIENCSGLTINGEQTRTTKDNSSGHRSAIWVYTRDAETDAYVEIVDSEDIVVDGSGGGIYVNSHSDNSASDDASAAWVEIDNSEVNVVSETYTWAAIFVNNHGTGEKATADITIKDSTVTAKAVYVGMMTSTKDAASTVNIANSNVTLGGTTAGIRAKANTSDAAEATVTNSVLTFEEAPTYVIDEMDNGASTDGTSGIDAASKVIIPATEIDLSKGSYTITEAGDYVVLEYSGANTLTIKADANVTLQNVGITAADGVSAISIESGKVTLVAEGASRLIGGKGGAGIYVAENAALTIGESDSLLVAIGNGGADTSDSGAAGIGGTYGNGNSGAITIDGAWVNAYGYGVHGSGIGSGSGKVVGEIKIINGANVYAQGGYYADGAGTKLQSSYGKTDPEGGAAIGGGGKTVSTIANITIADSTVEALGGSKAAGIGANFWSSCGTITISGNSVVDAKGGSSSAAIGTSRAGDNGVTANIVISGGTVTATGGAYGAGIGGGYNNDSLGNGAEAAVLPEISVTISGGTVTATGGEGGAGIGGGYKTDNVDIDITGGTVTAQAGEFVSGKTIDNGGEACAIGSGANGSGTFENSPAVEIGTNASVTVTTEYGGKPAIEGYTDEALEEMPNVFLTVNNEPVAQVGETKYASLTEALNACTNGETVKLIADITYGADDVVNAIGGATGFGDYPNPAIVYLGGTKGATAAENQPSNVKAVLDLNGHTITNTAEAHMFLIMDNANLTITDSVGGGKVTNSVADYTVVWSTGTDTVVTIAGGEYAGKAALMWATHSGDLVINGGKFDGQIVRNEQDRQNSKYFISGKSTITVKGGTFTGTNPAQMLDDHTNTTFNAVAKGYQVTENNGVYTVGEWDGVIHNKAELIMFAELVNAGNSFKGKTITLAADINLYEMGEGNEPVSFKPIGIDTPFEGTFDGQDHIISNLYQSGWAFGYEWGSYGSLGLFSQINNATIKNLTIKGAECLVEGGDVAGIAGSATGTCLFENVHIVDSTFATYNNGCAGIIGWAGAGAYTFKNVTVDENTVIAGLWGSFDSSLGGIMGQLDENATAHFENVDVACRIDAYNDVTASYKWYSYRMCGMLIGRVLKVQTINGTNYPDPAAAGVTIGDNVNVTFGDWAHYTYIWDDSLSYGCKRVESGYAYDGIDITAYPDADIVHIPFTALFGGPQSQSNGYYGLSEYAGVNVNFPAVAAIGETRYWSLADALAAAEDGQTVTVLATNHTVCDPVVVSGKSVTLDLNGKTVTGMRVFPVIRVQGDANLTVKNGTIENADYVFVLGASDGTSAGYLTIESGTYTGETTVASVTKGELTINGGEFKVTGDEYGATYLLNCIDANYKDSSAKISVKGGTFHGFNPEANAAEGKGTNFVSDGYVVKQEPENVWTVFAGSYVAQIGETRYTSLASAIAAVKNGETIVLLADNDEDVTIKQTKDLSFTIDGADKIYTGTITIDGNRRSNGAETLTIQNVNFLAEGEWQSSIFAAKNTYVHNVTVDGCTFTGTDAKQAYGIRLHHAYDITVKNTTGTKLYDLVYAQTAVTGFTAENVTVTDSGMGFMMPYGMNLSFKNVNLTTEGAGVGIYNYNASTATFDSCTFASAPAIWFGEKNTTNNYTLIFKGTNNFGTENWLTLDGQGAELTVDLTDSNLDIAKVTYDKSYYAVDTAEKVHTFRKGVFVAKIGEQHYESLAAAIEAVQNGETIVLLADNDEDVTIKQTKDLSFTIDGADKIYTGTIKVDGSRRSTGAETLTIQKVNFVADTAGQIFVQAVSGSYAHNITVDNCTFTGDEAKTAYGLKIPNSYNITVRNSAGAGLLDLVYSNKATTNFTAEDVNVTDSVNGFYMSYLVNGTFKGLNLNVSNIGVYTNNYNAASVTIADSTVVATYPVVLQQKNSSKVVTLTMQGANNLSGNWLTVDGRGATVTVDLTESDLDIAKVAYDATYYAKTQSEANEKVWLFTEMPDVAQIGQTKYKSLAFAIEAVQNGETIVLLADNDEDVTIKQTKDLSFTIDGADKIYTGTITIDGNRRSNGAETLTIQNVNFLAEGEWQSSIFAAKNTYVHNVTVDGCTFTGTDAKQAYGIRLHHAYDITVKNTTGTKLYDLVYAQTAVTGFTAENVTVTDSGMGFMMPYGKNLSFKKVSLEVSGAGVGIYNYNASTATFEDCTITAAPAIILGEKSETNAYTLVFKGTNTFAGDNWLNIDGRGATVTVDLTESDLDIAKVAYDATYYAKTQSEANEKVWLFTEMPDVAQIGQTKYKSLAFAIAAVKDGETIVLLADNDEDVTIKQTKDLSFTIDGADKIYTGTIKVDGSRRSTGAETLTIQKVNFVADTAGQIFVQAVSGSYAHNITVDNCTFTGDEAKTAYGLKIPNSYNITVKNSTGTKLLDLAYSNKVVTGFTAENVTVTDSVNGFYMSYMKNGSFAGLNLDVSNIGVYTNNHNASSMTIADSTIKAANPVVLEQKNAVNKYNVTISGTNSFTGTSATGEWLTVEGADASFKVTVNDAALDMTKTSGLVAKIGENGNVYYNRVNGAIADAVDGDTIYVIADAEEATTFDKNIVLEVGENKLLGKITVAEGAELTIMSGTFDDMEAKQYVHEKMYGKDNGDGTWTVVDYVLWIKAQLLAGNDVTLEKDIVLEDYSYVESIPANSNGNGKYNEAHGNGAIFNVIAKDATFDLNGHAITLDAHDAYYCNKRVVSLFYVTDGATLTVKDNVGTGKVDIHGMATAVYSVAVGSKAVLTGGTWNGYACKTCGAYNAFLYASHGGQIAVSGGSYAQVNNDSLIVIHGSSKENEATTNAGINYSLTDINITGGTFTMDPAKALYVDQATGSQTYTGNACADGYVSHDNGNGTWTVELGVAMNVNTGKGYGDVTDALDAAKSGETVKMLKDYTEILVTVSSGVTLDLNGCYLTASNFLSFGNVVDNGDTTGGLKITNDTSKAFTLLQPANTFMPLYDTANGCYRFYEYSVESLGTKNPTETEAKFGFRVRFTKPEGYKVLAESADTGMDLVIRIKWDGMKIPEVSYTITNDTLKSYAKNAYTQVTTGELKRAITVTITSLNRLPDGATLYVTPDVVSVTGVTRTGAEATYKSN